MPTVHPEVATRDATATPVPARRQIRCGPRHGRRSSATYYRWVDDALRHREDGYRLLDSPLAGQPGVQRLARRRSRRSAFADVHEARALRQQAIEWASSTLVPRQVLALQLIAMPSPWPPSRRSTAAMSAAARAWVPGAVGVSMEEPRQPRQTKPFHDVGVGVSGGREAHRGLVGEVGNEGPARFRARSVEP